MNFLETAREIVSPVTVIQSPTFRGVYIDGSEEGREAMRAMYRQFRYDREVGPLVAEALGAFHGSYRKTQANDRKGVQGYFIDAAEARQFVRGLIKKARTARMVFADTYREQR